MRTLLATLWQSDSAFPSGSFAFSNGVEGAARLGGSLNREKLVDLLASTLRHRWATADRVALLHGFHARDADALAAIDSAFEAATVPETLRVGSRRNGMAFLTAHVRLATPGAVAYRSAVGAGQALGHLPVAQGWLWRQCGLDAPSAVAASAYTCAAAMVNAAVRLGAIGAIEAQGALGQTLPVIADIADDAFEPADAIEFASTTPWLDIAAMRQGRSAVRLFSN